MERVGFQVGKRYFFWDWPQEGMEWWLWNWTPTGSRWTVWRIGPLNYHRANGASSELVGDKRRSGSVDSAPLAQSVEPPRLRADKIMTREEYLAVPLYHWHMVCWNYDGANSVGVKYDGRSPPSSALPSKDGA